MDLNTCCICFSNVVLVSVTHLVNFKIINYTFKNIFKYTQSSVRNFSISQKLLSNLFLFGKISPIKV